MQHSASTLSLISCPVILHAGRLPDLNKLHLDVKGPPIADMLPMAMLLLSLRTQLTSLRSLTLDLSQTWRRAGLAWAELADMTQLTTLRINYDGKVCAVLVSRA